MQTKSFKIASLLLLATGVVLLIRSFNQNTESEFYFTGYTMGKIEYNIKYVAKKPLESIKASTDSLLVAFNQALSTYIPESEISRFNKAEHTHEFESDFFYPILQKSLHVFQESGGSFDPTVMPLVNFWGFGFTKIDQPDTTLIAELLERVGFSKNITFDNKAIKKQRPDIQLDFSAIAKGYAVDVVAELLQKNGIKNYMVEIGGEAICKGKNAKGRVWRIGITNPKYKEEGQSKRIASLELHDRAIATSGNYEKFYIKNGKKYAHTIDPKNGYPVDHNLLSATVVMKDCMSADAWATAFMVMGLEKAKMIAQKQEDMDVFFTYDSLGATRTYMSKGFAVLD